MHPTRRRREPKRITPPPHERGRHQSTADILASTRHKWQKDTSTTSFGSHDARIEDRQVCGGSTSYASFRNASVEMLPGGSGLHPRTDMAVRTAQRLPGGAGLYPPYDRTANPRALLPGAPGMDPVAAACSGSYSKVPRRRYVGTFRRIKAEDYGRSPASAGMYQSSSMRAAAGRLTLPCMRGHVPVPQLARCRPPANARMDRTRACWRGWKRRFPAHAGTTSTPVTESRVATTRANHVSSVNHAAPRVRGDVSAFTCLECGDQRTSLVPMRLTGTARSLHAPAYTGADIRVCVEGNTLQAILLPAG
jgi:hypothetical protein